MLNKTPRCLLAGLALISGIAGCPGSAPTACQIGDTIYPGGTSNPANPCQVCLPDLNPLAWSEQGVCDAGSVPDSGPAPAPDAGPPTSCTIGGIKYSDGAANPQDSCQTCQLAISPSNWSTLADGVPCANQGFCLNGACTLGCLIANSVVLAGVKAPGGCQECIPAASLTTWTALPDGTICGAQTVPDFCQSGECQSGCYIAGTFHPANTLAGVGACQSCQPPLSTSAWSELPTGTTCGKNKACDSAGNCVPICICGCTPDGGPMAPLCTPGPASDLGKVTTYAYNGTSFSYLASADLNQDGILDLVGLPWTFTDDSIGVFLGQADGTLSAMTPYFGASGSGIAIADLNGDCFPDVVTSSAQGVSVFMNQGDGTLAMAVGYATTHGVGGVGIGDVNHDGFPDLVVGEVSDGAELLLNKGDGTFGAPTPLPAWGGYWGGVVVTDLNRDGLADIAMSGDAFFDDDWMVLLNQGDGGFQMTLYSEGQGGIAVLDVRGDGAPDLAIADFASTSVSVFKNDGAGAFSASEQEYVGAPGVGWIISGDFNGDCIPDIAATGWSSSGSGTTSTAVVLYGSVDGGHGTPNPLTSDAFEPSGMALLGPISAPRLLTISDQTPQFCVLGH